MAAYMHDTASGLHCRPKDINWVIQVPYELSMGVCLSSAGPTADFTSALSLALAHTAMVIECIFLEAEHEYLELSTGVEATGTPSCRSSSLLQQLRDDSRCQTHCERAVGTIAAPDGMLLQCLHVSTAVHGTCSMALAMKRVVCVMLRRHSTLPYALWKAACIRAIRWLQGTAEGMRRRQPIAEALLAQRMLAALQQRAGHSDLATGAPQQLPLAAVPAAQLVMTQHAVRSGCGAKGVLPRGLALHTPLQGRRLSRASLAMRYAYCTCIQGEMVAC